MVIQDSRERATTDRLPIVRSKYGSPVVPERVVARPRLSQALAGTEWRLALVSAGPASGKTVMVAQWFQTLEDVGREWVTLDVGDDRPERFWLALAVGFERAVPGGFVGAVELATDVRRSRQEFLDRLLMDMSLVEGSVVVVLDDVHFLRDPAIVEDLAWVVEHLPRNVQLVFTSRLDPLLPLARRRARSWLVEVRHRHLAFTAPETSQLFAALDEHRLGPGDIEELWRHTEGWAAGLRLAATAIRDRPDASAAAHEFSGRHRMVADLLVSEVLDGQSDQMSDFLLSTSIADVLDADLCDALSGRRDSSVVLRGLEADMPFLVATSTDRSSYRYHPLLGEMLRAELVRRRPGAAPRLHGVAAAVLEGRGDFVGAVGHLLAAGDTDRAFSLAFTNAFERSDHADKRAAAAWVDLFPQELAAGSVARMLTYALALGLLGRTDEGLAWLERAALRLADDPEPRAGDVGTLDALRLLAFTVSGAADDGPFPGRRALEAIDGGVDLGVVGARLRPNLARAWLLVDQPDQAEEVLTGEPVGDEVARLLVAPAVAGRIALRRGHLGEADRQATRALAAASALGLEAHLGTLDAYLARAGVLTERNQLGEATATFQRLDDIARRHPEAVVYHILLRVDQVRVANGRGGLDETFAMIDEMRHLLIGRSHPALEQIIDTVAARWRIEAGDINRAEQLITGLPNASPARALLAARLDLACGQPDAAITRLAPISFATLRNRLSCQLILARAADDSGRPDAKDHIANAVQLAVPEGFVKVFLEEGPVVTRLARAAAAVLHTPAGTSLAAALGAPLPARPAAQPGVQLSKRERAVLLYLPSRLTYDGISRECFMSVNTVKTHVKSIYAKLGVSSRADAVDRARLQGLL